MPVGRRASARARAAAAATHFTEPGSRPSHFRQCASASATVRLVTRDWSGIRADSESESDRARDMMPSVQVCMQRSHSPGPGLAYEASQACLRPARV